jgi:hypothetical protein
VIDLVADGIMNAEGVSRTTLVHSKVDIVPYHQSRKIKIGSSEEKSSAEVLRIV